MERAEWLNRMRTLAERLYDKISPLYWNTFGLAENETHRAYLQKFLDQVTPGGAVLSAGCGAGRYDGFLLEAGHPVLGIDLSAGMLKRAREHFPADRFPQLRYQKMGLLEIDFHQEFVGVICIDAMEHIFPEDYPLILGKFQRSLKPGGWLYFTMDQSTPAELEAAYQRALAIGLPVVPGEVVDRVDSASARVLASDHPELDAQVDGAVYHFYPSMDQAHQWIAQAGLEIAEEGAGSGYYHFLARQPAG